jgi:hypothetical protein
MREEIKPLSNSVSIQEIQSLICDLKEVSTRLDYALECMKSLQFHIKNKDYQEAEKIADIVDLWIKLALNRLNVAIELAGGR